MGKKILITGGAGFIGSHLCDHLLSRGYSVRLFDNLDPQVHGTNQLRPTYLDPHADLIIGDVFHKKQLKEALQGVDVVFHLAAKVGVGQSMYQGCKYTEVNNYGTANLMEILAKNPVEKLVVASSMSIYGEGSYQTSEGEVYDKAQRSFEQLKRADWEPRTPDGRPLVPIPTSEDKLPQLSSIYALSKYDQEKYCLIMGRAYHIPTVALRFFNCYGTRQALSNPYTGVLAIFATRLLNGRPPVIFEDGQQRRDFVSVHDVVEACRLSMETERGNFEAFNIASDKNYTIVELAQNLARLLQQEPIRPVISGKYRVGDVRHCFASIEKAKTLLGYQPKVSLEEGFLELVDWLQLQQSQDHLDLAHQELSARGLTL